MSAHTPEPWNWEMSPDGFASVCGPSSELLATVEGDQREADAARAVACVNALANCPDPEIVPEALSAAYEVLIDHAPRDRWAATALHKVAAALGHDVPDTSMEENA